MHITTTEQSKIELTEGRAALVSSCDLESLSQYTWCVTDTGYAMTRTGGKPQYMHRLVMRALPHVQVDHINGNKTDNNIRNLALLTNRENIQMRYVLLMSI